MPGMYRPCLVPQTPHMNIGAIGPHIRQNGPDGEGSAGIGGWNMNVPAHMNGPVDRQRLQPTNNKRNTPEPTRCSPILTDRICHSNPAAGSRRRRLRHAALW
jgi:hypothetical protein